MNNGYIEGPMRKALGRAGMRTMPAQKPGRSKQDYATPPEFIAAVKNRFSIKEFDWDLAASAENTKAPFFFDEKANSLERVWRPDGNLWLNPPFGKIAPFAKKCSEWRGNGTIFFLTPASVGANWFRDYVWNRADVYALNGRLSFDGKNPFPKDCMLSVFAGKWKRFPTRFDLWDWRP